MKDRLVTIVLSVAASFGLMQAQPERTKEIDVDRLIVRKELIVSDTGVPWEKGYEDHQLPRGIYAPSGGARDRRPVGSQPVDQGRDRRSL